MQHEVYKHSGKLGYAIFAVPIAAMILALFLSIAYAYLNVYSPLTGYISFIYLFGLSLLVGAFVSATGTIANCRNLKFMLLSGLLSGILTLYFSWAAFIYVFLSKHNLIDIGMMEVFISPVKIWSWMCQLNNIGWFNLFWLTPSGIFLWVLWGIEAIFLIGFTTYMSTHSVVNDVFCEECNEWCEKQEKPLRLSLKNVTSEDSRWEGVFNADLSVLETLPWATEYDRPQIEVEVQYCLYCEETITFQLKLISKGKYKLASKMVEKDNLTDILYIDRHDLEALEDITYFLSKEKSSVGEQSDDDNN